MLNESEKPFLISLFGDPNSRRPGMPGYLPPCSELASVAEEVRLSEYDGSRPSEAVRASRASEVVKGRSAGGQSVSLRFREQLEV